MTGPVFHHGRIIGRQPHKLAPVVRPRPKTWEGARSAPVFWCLPVRNGRGLSLGGGGLRAARRHGLMCRPGSVRWLPVQVPGAMRIVSSLRVTVGSAGPPRVGPYSRVDAHAGLPSWSKIDSSTWLPVYRRGVLDLWIFAAGGPRRQWPICFGPLGDLRGGPFKRQETARGRARPG